MSCTVNRYKFAKIVDFVAQFSSTKCPREYLRCIKLAITSDTITLSASDMEATAEAVVDCESSIECEVLVNAARLQRTLKVCDADQLELDTVGDDRPHLFTISSHDDRFEMPVMEGDLPSLPSVSEYYITLPPTFLARANAMTVACDTQLTGRFCLMAVQLRFSKDDMKLDTTDGRRLMHYCTQAKSSVEGTALIPYTVIRRVAKLKDIQFSFNQNMYMIETDGVKVAGQQVEGRFPNIDKARPDSSEWNARRTIDRAMLLNAIQRATIVCTEDQHSTDWVSCGRNLTIKAKSDDYGSSKVQIDCEREQGDANFSVSLDSMMLAEMLKELEDDEVTFTFKDKESALVFECGGVVMVQMPMNTGAPAKKKETEEATA